MKCVCGLKDDCKEKEFYVVQVVYAVIIFLFLFMKNTFVSLVGVKKPKTIGIMNVRQEKKDVMMMDVSTVSKIVYANFPLCSTENRLIVSDPQTLVLLNRNKLFHIIFPVLEIPILK